MFLEQVNCMNFKCSEISNFKDKIRTKVRPGPAVVIRIKPKVSLIGQFKNVCSMQETWQVCGTQNGSSIKALERHKNMQAETFIILLS